LPSITPGYLYTFAALIAVSSLLFFSFMSYVDALREASEFKQLKNLMQHVAAKGIQLLTLTLRTNATLESFLHMPVTIGNKQYWIQLNNDSNQAWLTGGFGNTPLREFDLRIYLPKEASARGYYVGGYGVACLKCYMNGSVPQILLTNYSEGD